MNTGTKIRQGLVSNGYLISSGSRINKFLYNNLKNYQALIGNSISSPPTNGLNDHIRTVKIHGIIMARHKSTLSIIAAFTALKRICDIGN